MKKLPADERKDQIVFVRLTKREKVAIEKLAKSRGLGLAELIRVLANRATSRKAA